MVLGHEVRLRAVKVAERVGGEEARPDPAGFDVAVQPPEGGPGSLGGSVDLEVLQVDGAQVHLHDGAAERPRGDIASLGPEQVDQGPEKGSAHDIGHHVHGAFRQERLQVPGPVAMVAAHHRLGAQGPDGIGLGHAAERIGNGPPRAAELDQAAAHAAGRAGHQDPLPRRDPGAVQHVLPGEVGAAEGRQFRVRDVRGGQVGVFRRHGAVLRVSAVTAVADVVDVGKALVVAFVVVDAEIHHDPLADAGRVHALARRDDHAHDVRALDPGKFQRRLAAPP